MYVTPTHGPSHELFRTRLLSDSNMISNGLDHIACIEEPCVLGPSWKDKESSANSSVSAPA